MGKRANLSGVSFFAAQVFNDDESTLNSATDANKQIARGTHDENNPNQESHERPADVDTDARPNKKRKVGVLGAGWEKYDATGLVPFYTHQTQVPEHLQKYFGQRERFFSLYSSGCLLDEEGWYSVTPERVANQIAERCRCDVILDAFCGVGGNAIAFARTCERVIALDTSPVRLALARHNAVLYGVADRIEFVLADFLSFAHQLTQQQELRSQSKSAENPNTAENVLADVKPQRLFDVIFLSPPWGGPSYLTDRDTAEENITESDASTQGAPEYNLASIKPVHGRQLFSIARRLTPNVAYYLPRNTKLDEIADLVNVPDDEKSMRQDGGTGITRSKNQNNDKRRKGKGKAEMVEVEEEWMGSKLKALTCYFGGLVTGQEDRF